MSSAKSEAPLQEMVSGKKSQISKPPIYVCLTLFIYYVAAPRPNVSHLQGTTPLI